jgi:hypothetical protein
MSVLKASKKGIVSRSTLMHLREGGPMPNYLTLAKLDELLEWEPGSAHGALYGRDPKPREYGPGVLAELVPEDSSDGERTPLPNASLLDVMEGGNFDYRALADAIDLRLHELGLSKTKFAALGGPGRSTLSNLGTRGYAPSLETLVRIDQGLSWEPGSALAVLRGGRPVRRGPNPRPHPAVISLGAVQDDLKALKGRLSRQVQSQMDALEDIDKLMRRTQLAINDLDNLRIKDTPEVSVTGSPQTTQGSAADQENDADD